MEKIIEQLRNYAGRKAKADALPEEIRGQYAETYAQVCRQLRALMVDLLLEVLQGLHSPPPDAVYAAMDDMAAAYNLCDVEACISAAGRIRAEAGRPLTEQMGFKNVEDPGCPWKKGVQDE